MREHENSIFDWTDYAIAPRMGRDTAVSEPSRYANSSKVTSDTLVLL